MTDHTVPNHLPIKDSGARQEFDTGSRRDSREGKGRFDLLPMRALQRLARHFEAGSKKYGDRNWEKGQPMSRYIDSAMRHVCHYMQGKRDEDHLIAACWNLMCAAETEMRIEEGMLQKELNDLPKPHKERKVHASMGGVGSNPEKIGFEVGSFVYYFEETTERVYFCQITALDDTYATLVGIGIVPRAACATNIYAVDLPSGEKQQ